MWGEAFCLGTKRGWPVVKGLSPHTLTQTVLCDTSEEKNTHTLLLPSLIWVDFCERKMAAWKMCVKVPKCQWGGEGGGVGGSRIRLRGNGFMKASQYKVCVGGLPNLQEKNHSRTHSGSKDCPCGMSMLARMWQSLSSQGPAALNYWAVTSNNNLRFSKTHWIIRDV